MAYVLAYSRIAIYEFGQVTQGQTMNPSLTYIQILPFTQLGLLT